jgi:hypothetical protein
VQLAPDLPQSKLCDAGRTGSLSPSPKRTQRSRCRGSSAFQPKIADKRPPSARLSIPLRGTAVRTHFFASICRRRMSGHWSAHHASSNMLPVGLVSLGAFLDPFSSAPSWLTSWSRSPDCSAASEACTGSRSHGRKQFSTIATAKKGRLPLGDRPRGFNSYRERTARIRISA